MFGIDMPTLQIDRAIPLQQQIHRQLSEWICMGRLAPGSALCSSRALAQELGISRNTVVLAFEQLRAEGFIQGRPGKGFFVSEHLQDTPKAVHFERSVGKPAPLPGLSQRSRSVQRFARSARQYSSLPFAPGIPDLDAFPHKIWTSLVRRHSGRRRLMGYDGEQGLLELRQALAHYLGASRGVHCRAENILVTHGAQQAIALAAFLLLDPGDRVLIENPGYMGAKKAFAAAQTQLLPLPLNRGYIDVQALINSSESVRLLYTTPTHQYPMGGIMPARDRLDLMQWAVERDCWILEDDYDSEFCYQQKPVAALQGMSPDAPVIYMGSFSKTLFPALRLGYLVLPDALMEPCLAIKHLASGETAQQVQAVLADFIAEGHFTRHLRRMRKHYQGKFERMRELIESELQDLASWRGASAGMHLVLSTACDDRPLQEHMARAGHGGSALSSYCLEPEIQQGLVLGFANTTERQRTDGIKCLRNLLESDKGQ